MEEEKTKAKKFEASVAELEASKRMVESLKEQLSILEVYLFFLIPTKILKIPSIFRKRK